jgi:hypothetical protein
MVTMFVILNTKASTKFEGLFVLFPYTSHAEDHQWSIKTRANTYVTWLPCNIILGTKKLFQQKLHIFLTSITT